MDRGGQMVSAKAAELCAEHMFKAAKLAALPTRRPRRSGGWRVKEGKSRWVYIGYTLEEATIDELV
eukprot:8532625-Pyramimonas_sp.AAC.1